MAVIESLAMPLGIVDRRRSLATDAGFPKAPAQPLRPQMALESQSTAVSPLPSKGGFRAFFGRKLTKANASSTIIPPPESISQAGMSLAEQDATSTGSIAGERSNRQMLTSRGRIRKASRATAAAHSKASDAQSTVTVWEIPPLFEAYPQAVKHAYLPVPLVPVEQILRRDEFERDTKLRQGRKQSAGSAGTNDSSPSKTERVRLDQAAANLISHWTHKIFVLVESGYILQYAAKGSYDRMPEKILSLERDSAVFVSDAIPGKHWVLQVSHRLKPIEAGSANASGAVSRKPSLKGPLARKVVRNILLVLHSAEERECWMSTIRKQIQILGGNPIAPEAHIREQTAEATRQPSMDSCLTVVDPGRLTPSNPFGLSPPGFFGNRRRNKPPRPVVEDGTGHHWPLLRPSSSTGSSSTTMLSDDQVQLERLRDEFDSSSWSSALSTSRGTSPATSPTGDEFSPYSKQFSMLSSAMARLETREPYNMRVDGRGSLDHSGFPLTRTRSRSDSQRTNSSASPVPPRSSQGHFVRHGSTASTATSAMTLAYTSSPTESVFEERSHAEKRKAVIAPSMSPYATDHFDFNDTSDPTEEIAASIYQLLNSPSSARTVTTSDTGRRRSSSTQQRHTRRAAGSRPRANSRTHSAPGTTPKPTACDNDVFAPYRPKPLRINKTPSPLPSVEQPLATAVEGPPPVPPPDCPLPAVPPENAPSPNIWTGGLRAAELRKQSWKVMRTYHPVRLDVV